MKHLVTSAALLLSLSLVACGGDPKKEDVCDCDDRAFALLCEGRYDECESDDDCDLRDEETALNDICKLDVDSICERYRDVLYQGAKCEAEHKRCSDMGGDDALSCLESFADRCADESQPRCIFG